MSPETREVFDSVVDGLYGNLVARIAAARKKSPDEVRAHHRPRPVHRGPGAQGRAGGRTALRRPDVGAIYRPPGRRAEEGVPRARTPGARRVGGLARAKAASRWWWPRATSCAAIPGDNGSGETALTSYGFDKVLQQRRERFRHQGRDRAHRFAGRRGDGVRRDLARDEPAEQEEADGDFHVRHGRVGRLLHGHDRRPDCGVSGTDTGSIGVVFGKPNLHGLYDKLGVTKNPSRAASTPTSIPTTRRCRRRSAPFCARESTKATAISSPRWPPHGIADSTTSSRWRKAASGWDRKPSRAGWWTNWAVSTPPWSLVKKRAGIPAGEQVAVEIYPEPTSILDLLLKRPSPEDLLEAGLAGVFGGMPFHAWMKGGYLRLMPYWVDVR